jgi:hypothetical protein
MLQLGLSQQQQCAIADSLSLAKSLVSPLLSQQRALHADLAAADLTNLGHAVRPAAAAAAAAATAEAAGWTLNTVFGRQHNMSSAAAATASISAGLTANAPALSHGAAAAPADSATLAAMQRWSQLPLQQERAAGLLRVLRKGLLVSNAFTCHVLGCLTWQQLGTLMVHW